MIIAFGGDGVIRGKRGRRRRLRMLFALPDGNTAEAVRVALAEMVGEALNRGSELGADSFCGVPVG
ncbi:MAG: hypothetical protein V3S60_03275 [Acidimicrobiia bacterium]